MAHDFEKKWRSQDVRLKENVDFSSMLLSDRVLKGLEKAGFKKPSPIQLEAIPIAKIGKDLIVQAKSGTGKTLIFVITALETLRRRLFRPQVIVFAPTREIATQICSVVKSVSSAFPKLKCCNFIGGLSVKEDIENALTCQIVVGTPGRLHHLITDKVLPVNSVRLLVFDEADQLLQLSFTQQIEEIFKLLPLDKQVITTSATYPEAYRKTILRYLREPYLACLNSTELALLGIVHYAKVVKGSPMPLLLYNSKRAVLEEILKAVKFSQCIVFCNSIQRVEVLYKDIKRWGFSTTYITSAKEQYDRQKAVDRLKGFKCKVLVTSNVTARGIDAENVDFVINFDLPFDTETYMHRAGRAGRYGSVGVTISIVDEKELLRLAKIENTASFKTFKLSDEISEDLIQEARFVRGEFVIKPEEIQTLKMLHRKQKGAKTEEFDDNEDFVNSSHTQLNGTNCAATEPVENLLLENKVKKLQVFKNESIQIPYQPLEEQRTENIIEKFDSEKLDLPSSETNCVSVELSDTEQLSILEKDAMKSKSERTGHEHLPKKDLYRVSCVCTSPNSHCICESYGETLVHDGNISDKLPVESTDTEKSNSYSEALVTEAKAEQDGESVEVKDNESHLPVSHPQFVSQTLIKDETSYQKNGATIENIQKVELYDVAEKTELGAVAKIFTDYYEFSGEKEPIITEDSSDVITPSMINNLNCRKTEYFYNVFKKLQENKLQSTEHGIKVGDNASGSLESLSCQQVEENRNIQSPAAKESVIERVAVNSESLAQSYQLSSFSEQNVIADRNGAFHKYSSNPRCESTPRLGADLKGHNQLQGTDKSVQELPKLSNLLSLFPELSDELDSNDDEEEFNEDFAESECSSDTEDSEESSSDSFCDSSSSEGSYSESCSGSYSYQDSTNESNCRGKKRFTRKHSSSSVSDSSASSKDFKDIHCSGYKVKPCCVKSCSGYYRQDRNSSGKKSQCHRVGLNNIRHSECSRQCHRSCFMPSEHVCKCYEMPVCVQWHMNFYNQWQHIQSCVNSQLYFHK